MGKDGVTFLTKIRRAKSFLLNLLNMSKNKIISAFCLFLFRAHKIKENTVLLAEANNCHTELFPSYVKYLKDLNYNVEILARPSQLGFLPNLKCRKFFCTPPDMDKIFHTEKVKNYNFIFFTSYKLYFKPKEGTGYVSCLNDHFNNLKSLKTLIAVHHREDIEEVKKQTKGVIVLSEILSEEGVFVVNPCYFVENKIKDKNKKTRFITVGKFEEDKRKSAKLLYDTAYALAENFSKKTNCEIVVLGSSKLKLPKELKKIIKIKGKLGFKRLFSELQNSDFYLSLLDFENEAHRRYIKDGTSGSFQLIRGFLTPPVIEENFAKPHKFNENNAIIYNGNSALSNAVKRAAVMKNDEFKTLQIGLLNSKREIEEKSRRNLQKAIEAIN